MSFARTPLGQELRDPWTWVVTGIMGGLAWAVGAPLALAALVAGVVLVVKVGIGAPKRMPLPPPEEPERPDALPPVSPGSPAGRLVSRGEAAVGRIAALAASPGDPWLRDQVGNVTEESIEALDSMRAIAGRVTLVEQSMAVADPARLNAEAQRLAGDAASTSDPRLRSAQEASLAAVREQLEVAERLGSLREALLARMETGVLGLEGLAARMGEVVALGATAVEHDRAGELVSGLGQELEALRSGLDEASRLPDPQG